MKKAIVIAATSGIGKELTKLLVENNYKVGISGRLAELLLELKMHNTQNFVTRSFDITDIAKITEHLEALVNELGRLDLLVLCSGTGDLNDDLTFEIEKRTIDTNVSGFTCVSSWTFNYFKKQGLGHLAAISSLAGLRGGRSSPAYNATKAYQINYLGALRQKATRHKLGINITDIRSGFVNTAMIKGEGPFGWLLMKKPQN